MSRSLVLGLVIASSLALVGCSGSDGSSGDGGAGDSATTAAYLPVPDGVELTAPGSQLAVGDPAVVAYHPRQGQVGALDITVTDLEQAPMRAFSAWQLSAAQKQSNAYFVRADVTNVGDTDLGGRDVPLYVVNEDDVLLEATPFASSFKPCPSTPFPEKFGPGDEAKVCLVYLAPDHGSLEAVSFRPDETFNPITWTGDVVKYQPPEPTKKPSPEPTKKPGKQKQ